MTTPRSSLPWRGTISSPGRSKPPAHYHDQQSNPTTTWCSTRAFVTMVGQILREPVMHSRRRFLRAAFCAGIAGLCRGEQAFSVPVRRTKTKLATVPVFVGRKRLVFVADTGAPNTMIASEALRRLAQDDFQSRGTTYMGFAGGGAPAKRIALRSFALRSGEEMPLEVTSIGLSGFHDQFGAEVDGVLGMDVLARYSLRLDLRSQRLDLLPFRAALAKRNAPAAFDFAWTSERRILFPAHLNGHRLTALLDTGCVQTGVNWAAAKQASVTLSTPGLTQRNTIVGGDGTPWVVHEYRFPEMRIGSLLWSRPSLVVADVNAFQDMQLADKPAAIVGMDLLDKHEIFLSFSERRFTIQ